MSLTPMMQQYLRIKKQYPEYLLMFRLGDFYEFFMEDAKKAAKVLNITLTSRPTGKNQRVPMAGIPHHAARSYIKKLLSAGYKIAICEQTSEPNNRTIVDREVVRIITPGTYIDEEFLDEATNTYVFTFLSKKDSVGFAFCDLSTGEFYSNEERNINPAEFVSELLRTLPIKEIVVENEEQAKNFKNLLSLYNISVSLYSPSDIFSPEEYIKEYFDIKSLKTFNLQGNLAIYSTALLLSYLNYTQRNKINQITSIKIYSPKKYLYLDPATIRNLEIFESYYSYTKAPTLISVIDECKTPMGKRLLRKLLSRPLKQKSEIEKRLQAVEFFIKHKSLLTEIRSLLNNVRDIERIVSKISSNIHSPADFINLKDSLYTVFKIKTQLANIDAPKLLQTLVKDINNKLKELANEIDKTIVENPIEAGEGNRIKPGVSKKLDELKKLTLNNKEWLLNLEKKEKEKTGIPTLKIGYNKVFGYYIEITKPYIHKVPKEYIRKQTLTNSERYITLELKEMEEKILIAEEEILKEEKIILGKLQEKILSLTKVIQKTSESIAFIDVLSNFAHISFKYDYTKPIFTNENKIEIKGGRHPVVERFLYDSYFVDNDTFLDKKDQQIIVITGPNMAGKSVYIRQVALISLLAHIGCFVPAKSATLCVLDRIAVRSGAGDIITEGLSTFMVEMVETASILNSITDRSLVVLDEIGRGTSTYDGISIAWAIVEYLAKTKDKKAFALFATHYHELQNLEEYNSNVKNYQMAVKEIDGESVFTYKLTRGAAPHSFGIHVAKVSGLPKEVIRRAKEILKILEGKTQNIKAKKIILHQFSLFSKAEDHPIINEIKNLKIENITPLQALNLISKWKNQVK